MENQKYFVFSTHREENVDDKKNLIELIGTLNAVVDKYDLPIIVSTHPRTRKRINELGNVIFNKKIQFINPLGFLDYIQLQKNAKAVISDSGTITEESSILNFPAVTIRQQHERPEGMDEGTLIMTGLNKNSVLSAIDVVMKHNINNIDSFKMVTD